MAWFSTCIVWGTTYLAIRVGVQDLPPFLFAGFRWVLAGSLFLLVLRLTGKKLPPKKDFIHLTVVGLSLLGIANGLVVYAEQWIPSGLAALIVSTLPFWVVSLESVLPIGNKINLKIIAGVSLGLTGTLLIFKNEINNLVDPDYLSGIIAIMIGIIVWGSGSLYSKFRTFQAHPLMNASVQMIIAGTAQSIFGVLIGEYSSFIFTPESLWAFIYLVFIGSILGYASYIYALAHLPASFATTYAYINPIIALYLGWLFLGEDINMTIIIATVIILIGVTIVRKGSSEAVPKKIEHNNASR